MTKLGTCGHLLAMIPCNFKTPATGQTTVAACMPIGMDSQRRSKLRYGSGTKGMDYKTLTAVACLATSSAKASVQKCGKMRESSCLSIRSGSVIYAPTFTVPPSFHRIPGPGFEVASVGLKLPPAMAKFPPASSVSVMSLPASKPIYP